MRSIDSETEEFGMNGTSTTNQAQQKRGQNNNNPQAVPRRRSTATSQRRNTVKSEKYTFIDFLKDGRTHLGTGIVICLFALIMAITGASFLLNYDADQSIIHGHSISEIVASGKQVQNAGGAAGAKLAEIMMVKSFGIGSFVIAFYLFVIGLAIAHIIKIKFFSFTFRCLFTAVAVSIITGLFCYNSSMLFNLGGEHGHYINKWLLDYSGALGQYCVCILLIGLLITIYINPLKHFYSMLAQTIQRRRNSASVEPDDAENADINSTGELDITDDDENFDTDLENDESDNKPDYDRYMPQPDFRDFDEETEEEKIESGNESHERESGKDDGSANVLTIPSEKVEPELTIVQKSLGESSETETEAGDNHVIRHGDHITLDQPYDVRASHSNYVFPPTSLLVERTDMVEINEAEQMANKRLIVDALRSYKVEIQRIEATVGPTVTLYEIVPAEGTRIAKIKSLEDDIAMSLSALGIRIIAPMPGKGTVGIEVPNRKPQVVSMRKILESKTFRNTKMALPMALGATISNDIFMADLAKLPHLLVAGATGQGKSVGLNCIITSLLYSKHPDELKFVLVDPKTVEFSLFETISHQYLAKLPDEEKAVITDPQKVVSTLYSLCVEMENRYALLSDARVKQISEYNERFMQRRLNPEDGHRFMPYIVVIVDEYADLVMTAGREVAVPIARITQKARAVGIHMILATQRPSTDVITGMIKNNFTARIAFKVTQGVDSKTILDRPGAQRLIGRGDMLTLINGVVERVQCAFIDTPEVEAICEHIGNQQGFVMCYELPEAPAEDGGESGGGADYGNVTEEFKRCAMFISTQSQASITMMQRKFEIGFNKAGRFMDQMQQMGIVGPAKGAKPRDVLMTPDEVQRLFE